jgi:beta-xylosidase
VWQIKLRKSKTIGKLKGAPSKTLLSSSDKIAAPSITYMNKKYYLLVEAITAGKWNNRWVTLAYESKTIDGKYREVSNNPVLSNNDACAFQYIFDNQLYVFYSHGLDTLAKDGASMLNWWDIRMVKATK